MWLQNTTVQAFQASAQLPSFGGFSYEFQLLVMVTMNSLFIVEVAVQ